MISTDGYRGYGIGGNAGLTVDQMRPLAWTVFDLFTNNFELSQGMWKVPFFTPPIQFNMTSLQIHESLQQPKIPNMNTAPNLFEHFGHTLMNKQLQNHETPSCSPFPHLFLYYRLVDPVLEPLHDAFETDAAIHRNLYGAYISSFRLFADLQDNQNNLSKGGSKLTLNDQAENPVEEIKVEVEQPAVEEPKKPEPVLAISPKFFEIPKLFDENKVEGGDGAAEKNAGPVKMVVR
jgi:hypothetical protein